MQPWAEAVYLVVLCTLGRENVGVWYCTPVILLMWDNIHPYLMVKYMVGTM